MSFLVSNHSLQHAHDDPVEEQSCHQDRSTRLTAERNFSNRPSALRASSIACRPQTSLPFSRVPSLSMHSDDTSVPASFVNESRFLFAKVDEKKSQNTYLKQPRWWSRLAADFWILELIAGFVSLATIASIIGVLLAYDQKPVPPLMKGITLNAVIAFLAMISRTAIMLCIGTGLSQGKWLWLKKERSLMDLQTIENASRDPLGAILMVFKFRGGAVLYIASFLTVATLGFDPFVQQLLTTQNQVVRVPASGISINSTISMTSDISGAMTYPETSARLTAAMLADVEQGDQLYSDVTASIPERRTSEKRSNATTQTLVSALKADCPSGNCAWKPYYALDICTQCRSTTKDLRVKNLSPEARNLSAMISLAQGGGVFRGHGLASDFKWEIIPKSGYQWQVASTLGAFPDHDNMSGNPKALNISGTIVRKVVWPLNFVRLDRPLQDTTVGWIRQNFAGIDEPVAAIGFAEFNFGDNGVPVLNNSLECAVTYCVKEYNRSVVQGNLVSNVLSTHYGRVIGDPNVSSYLVWLAEVNGTSFIAGPILTYGTGIETLADYVLGNTTYEYRGSCFSSRNWSCSAPVTLGNRINGASSNVAWQGIDLTSDFTKVLENMNTLMSDIVQQHGNVSIVGENAVTKQFVVVRWVWLTLPATVIFFGLIVLGLTVWETIRQQAPSWKSSLLPLIYRHIHMNDGRAGGRSNPVAAEPATTRSPPMSDGCFTSSNLVSKFEAEAETTVTRLTKDTTGSQIWQLQSLEIVPEDTKRGWQRFKWW